MYICWSDPSEERRVERDSEASDFQYLLENNTNREFGEQMIKKTNFCYAEGNFFFYYIGYLSQIVTF